VIIALINLCCLDRAAFAAETHRFGASASSPFIRTTPHPSRVVLFVSGNGSGAGIDGEIAANHMPVVDLNALQYFWKPRTPAGAAHNLDRIREESGDNPG
jgi:type IV secretory pathway VirJ component